MTGPRVLVVDDEPQIQRFLTVALTAAGFQVQTSRNRRPGLASGRRPARPILSFSTSACPIGTARMFCATSASFQRHP